MTSKLLLFINSGQFYKHWYQGFYDQKYYIFFLSWRLCIYYRCLNAMTVVSKYPVPIVEELLDVWCLMVF